MGHWLSHYYLPWIYGFGFSVFAGHLFIKPASHQMWLAVDLDPGSEPSRPSRWHPEALGLIERPLFTAALLTGNGGFIAVWLGLKTVVQLPAWGVNQEGITTGRRVSGREVYVNFMLGTGLSIAFAATGAYATRLLLVHRVTPAALISLATLLGTVAFTLWIRWRGNQTLEALRKASKDLARNAGPRGPNATR